MNAPQGKVVRSLAWTTLESVGVFGVALAALPVYAHHLTPSELGLAAMALGVVQLLNVPIESWLQVGLIQRRDAGAAHYDSAHTGTLLLGCLLCALCWFGADAFAAQLGEPGLAPLLRAMGLSLPLSAATSAVAAWQRRAMDFRPIAVRTLVGRLAGGLAGIALAIVGAGPWSLVAQQLLMTGLASACIWFSVAERPRLRLDGPALRFLAGFGGFSTVNLLLVQAVQRSFVVLVGALLGSQAAGYFNLAFRTVDVLRDVFAGAVGQLALPLFSRVQDDRVALHQRYHQAVGYCCALLFPLFAGLAACADEVVRLAFGERWLAAVPLIALLSLLTFQFFPRMFAAPAMNAVGRPAGMVWNAAIQLAMVLAGLLLPAQPTLAWAAAVWALRLLPATPVDCLALRRASGIGLAAQWRGVPQAALGAGAMAAIVYALGLALAAWPPGLRLPAMVAAGVAAYGLFLLLFRRGLLAGLQRALAEGLGARPGAARS
ncbi:oligosaccharide flippase family protein [Chitinimonas koreensis]|uniref:oligosaccharide flippase family protein n=1 Tax=Chitinimonas koreensis TaxID=356302 RepID=UPI000401A684|nr:oligosaccharide flippase family protein [Chitinimonas koreensis]QNM95046.1 oligosaccharide flippase family protein [Chitinimonas koreensis]